MKTIVISLGGSVIIPEKINTPFLDSFKKELQNHYSKYKFVLVTGGGSIARKYMAALEEEHRPHMEIVNAGMRATRMNALFLMQFFGKKEANDILPRTMLDVKNALSKNNVVICGALRYKPESTSDSTAAQLANFLDGEFINLTNVKGLYSKDPKNCSTAKLIPNISWSSFESLAKKRKYHPGQHFVLDQQAATIIRKNKIRTYILGPNAKNLCKLLKNKSFIGTTIEG